jgi:hypothetical protein
MIQADTHPGKAAREILFRFINSLLTKRKRGQRFGTAAKFVIYRGNSEASRPSITATDGANFGLCRSMIYAFCKKYRIGLISYVDVRLG